MSNTRSCSRKKAELNSVCYKTDLNSVATRDLSFLPKTMALNGAQYRIGTSHPSSMTLHPGPCTPVRQELPAGPFIYVRCVVETTWIFWEHQEFVLHHLDHLFVNIIVKIIHSQATEHVRQWIKATGASAVQVAAFSSKLESQERFGAPEIGRSFRSEVQGIGQGTRGRFRMPGTIAQAKTWVSTAGPNLALWCAFVPA